MQERRRRWKIKSISRGSFISRGSLQAGEPLHIVEKEHMKMTILVQLILYCILLTGMVRLAVRGGAINGLYFYPKPVQERAITIGLTTQDAVSRKRRRFMVLFYLVMLAALSGSNELV